jgi:hypothetical protein
MATVIDFPSGPSFVVGEGPKNSRTDPETGLRFYTWQGVEYPSVTTIRRMAGVPHKLSNWSISQVVNRAVEDFHDLTLMLTRDRRPRERVLEKNREKEAKTWLRAAATEERDLAAELGTAVHDAAATGLDPDTVEAAVRPRLLNFRHWLKVSGCEILATEFQVWNLKDGYAGTVDLLCQFPDRSLWLIDLKTGRGVYSDHVLQLQHYVMADFVGKDDVIDERLTQLLRAVSGAAVLHLADDHWNFISVRLDRESWQAAMGLLKFATWTAAHEDVATSTLGSRKGHA